MAKPRAKGDETLPQRRNRARPVSGDVAGAADSAFARAGFRDPTLVMHWEQIAGPEVARLARPLKLRDAEGGGTLTLKAEPGAALFLQHESRALCGRINTYLGRQAVTKLKFVQAPLLPPHPPAPRPRQPGPVPPGDPALDYRGPEALREALLRFARIRDRRA
ncbi:MAG: DUF721 domain-containing protein [Alphaproteobacteria bacterium]|nr:DUF721 domain-containing protein [Alphaproteobacteria bacterium]